MMYVIIMTLFITVRILVKLVTLPMAKADREEINRDIKGMKPDKKDF